MKLIDKNSVIGFVIHTYGPIDPQTYFNHMGSMRQWAKMYNMIFIGIDGHRTADARNILIESARSNGCTHLLIIDTDHIVPAHMIECLSNNKDALIASGLVCKRKPPFQQVGFCLVNGEYHGVDLPVDGRSYSVDVPAMGATMFDISVFDTIDFPWFQDTKGVNPNGELYNKRSDTNFFEKAQRAKISMVIDTRVIIGHLGDRRPHYPTDQVSAADLNREHGIRLDADAQKWQAEVYEKAKSIVVKNRLSSVLDLGCGNPIKLKKIGELVKLVGVDFPEKIEAISRRDVKGEWIGKDINYPFDLGMSFDLVIAADVIEHINSVDVFFDAVITHLKSNGILLISSPEKSTVDGANDLHVQEFTKAELTGIIGAHGFEVLEWNDYEQKVNKLSYTNNVFLCRMKGEKNG